jgi:hypothetical protein
MGLFSAIPNTDWTLIKRAGEPGSTPQQQAMHTLLTLYYPALRAYVVSKWRFPHDRAEEYVQEFLATKVVGENLIAQARAERGRFRYFIRATLDAFIVSQIRHEAAQKRSPRKLTALPSADLIADQGPDASEAFEIAWAREVIAEAVAAMRQECLDVNRPDIWALFETRILLPSLDGSDPVAYAQLVVQFGFRSPVQASNALTSAKRMFDRKLRLVLSSYSDSEEEVDEELGDLRTILSAG